MAELELIAETGDWLLFISTSHSNAKWTNFRVLKKTAPSKQLGQGKKKTFWSAFNGARMAQNADAMLLRKTYPDVNKWVVEKLTDYRNSQGLEISTDKPVKDFASPQEADQFWQTFERADDAMVNLSDNRDVFIFHIGDRNDGEQSFAILLENFPDLKRRKLWIVTDQAGRILPIGDHARFKEALGSNVALINERMRGVLNVH